MKTSFGKFSPVGFGCSPFRDGKRIDLADSIALALEAGYQLLDTAEAYGNEAQIGEILRRRRSSPYQPLVVGKVWQTNHAYADVLSACESSLRRLGREALDLYLIHAPEAWQHTGLLGDLSQLSPEVVRSRTMPRKKNGARALAEVPLAETWSAMEELHNRGLVRAIGVSNFGRAHLEELLADSTIPPAVNQIERHPCRPRTDLVEFCRGLEIQVMAHSPLSGQVLLQDSVLTSIAERCGKSTAQVILRWSVELDVIPIPSSRNARHIKENLDIFDFALEAAERAEIDGLSRAPAHE